MPTLDTPRALYEHDHQIAARCPRCQRWETLGLLDFVKMGKAEHHISWISLRCAKCDEQGQAQMRPPSPQIDSYGPAP